MKKRVYIVLFGVLSVVLRFFFDAYPDLCEQWYGRGCFVIGRSVWDTVFGWSPIPLIYVFTSVLLIISILQIILFFIRKKKQENTAHFYKRFLQGTANSVLSIFAFLSLVLGLFLVQWGYNYCRPSLVSQINLHPVDTLTLSELKSEANFITKNAFESRSKIKKATEKAYRTEPKMTDLEPQVRKCLVAVLKDFKYPVAGCVRGRELPAGTLLSFNTAGIYLPWVGEGHIDAGLQPLQKPFTLAHELSHGYGFTDEGTCNFLAYLACIRSDDPYIRYSGELTYWRYVFSALRQKNRSSYLLTRAHIPQAIHNDLVAIKDAMARYPDRLQGLQASLYDGYLKTQGIKSGMDSYENIVQLAIAWRKTQH